MKQTSALVFKVASERREFEQIHSLNYRTFVERIPQHPPNVEKKLVDKFHKENTYFICLRDKKLLGMICVRDKRPFSLDEKLENLNDYLPVAKSICEIRLLAVEKYCNTSRIFFNLITRVAHYFMSQGYDLAIISGTVLQLKLYRHIGFVPFGPLVGRNGAKFQPMYITKEAVLKFKNESKYFWGRNYDKWQDTYVHAPYISRMTATKDGVHYLQGWVDWNDEVKELSRTDPDPQEYEGVVYKYNYIFRIYGKGAWVSFEQMDNGTKTLETRILEKVNGKWKIVMVGLVYDANQVIKDGGEGQ